MILLQWPSLCVPVQWTPICVRNHLIPSSRSAELVWLLCAVRHDKANDVNGAFDGYGNFVIPTPESAAAALLSIISGSTREKEGGEFVLVSGEHLGW